MALLIFTQGIIYMKLKTTVQIAVATVSVVLIIGCTEQTPEADKAPQESLTKIKPAMPEVNDENCKNILQLIEDPEMRREFSSKCIRRGGFVPSPKVTYNHL
jgi:entry exclusion lipoprotein TrbK